MIQPIDCKDLTFKYAVDQIAIKVPTPYFASPWKISLNPIFAIEISQENLKILHPKYDLDSEIEFVQKYMIGNDWSQIKKKKFILQAYIQAIAELIKQFKKNSIEIKRSTDEIIFKLSIEMTTDYDRQLKEWVQKKPDYNLGSTIVAALPKWTEEHAQFAKTFQENLQQIKRSEISKQDIHQLRVKYESDRATYFEKFADALERFIDHQNAVLQHHAHLLSVFVMTYIDMRNDWGQYAIGVSSHNIGSTPRILQYFGFSLVEIKTSWVIIRIFIS